MRVGNLPFERFRDRRWCDFIVSAPDNQRGYLQLPQFVSQSTIARGPGNSQQEADIVTVENCLIARYTPAAWRATMYGMKFVLALGLSSVGVPLVALIYGSSGSFDGVFWALIACAAIVMVIGMALPRTASPAAGAAIQPAE